MSVHYKFKNTIEYDAVKFDGVYISASDLKSIIVQQKKLGNSELQVENEETGQIYKEDENIPKNTNIIVIRLPCVNKRTRNHPNQPYLSPTTSNNSSIGREAMELVSTKDMNEEEKIKYIKSQSTKDFDPARYARGNRGRPHGKIPGAGYTCRKCGIPGHLVYDCKSSMMPKVKRSSGIPRDFLMPVDSKEKGALMTPDGGYAVPIIDREAYNNPKIEKAPFFEDGTHNDKDETTTKHSK